MPPILDGTASDHGAYTPTLIDRYPRLCGFVIGLLVCVVAWWLA